MPYCSVIVKSNCCENASGSGSGGASDVGDGRVGEVLRRGVTIAAAAAVGVVVVLSCRRALAVEGVANAGYALWERNLVSLKSSWPKVLQVLTLFKEQGLILAVLLSLSAFFSMAETSITTLWPWKVLRI